MTTIIDFPVNMPDPLLVGYKPVEFEHFQFNDVQSGPPRFEFLTDDRPMIASLVWTFDRIDFQIFEAWYKFSLNFGTSSFNIDLLVGMGFVSHECNFLESYVPTPNGRKTRVSAQLIAVRKQYNTDEDCQDLLVLNMATVDDKTDFWTLFLEFSLVILPDEWEDIKYGTDHS